MGRPEAAQVKAGEPFGQAGGVEELVGDPHVVQQAQEKAAGEPGWLQEQHSGSVEAGQRAGSRSAFRETEVVGPRFPPVL